MNILRDHRQDHHLSTVNSSVRASPRHACALRQSACPRVRPLISTATRKTNARTFSTSSCPARTWPRSTSLASASCACATGSTGREAADSTRAKQARTLRNSLLQGRVLMNVFIKSWPGSKTADSANPVFSSAAGMMTVGWFAMEKRSYVV